MGPIDLEALKEVVGDKRVHFAVAQIKKVVVTSDRSEVRCEVSIFPEQREIVARMSWSAVGPEAGIFMLPVVNDLVLVAMANGDEATTFVVSRLTSREDKVPLKAVDGDIVAKALSGKKVWMISGSKINLARGDTDPTENLVLGQVFKTFMSSFLEKYIAHKHIGNLGYLTAPPDNAADVSALKSSPVDNGNILSDVAFTQK